MQVRRSISGLVSSFALLICFAFSPSSTSRRGHPAPRQGGSEKIAKPSELGYVLSG
jgi:hypothetical protein